MKKNNKFYFISKAKTLLNLKDKIKKSFILDIIKFDYKAWKENKNDIIKKIQNKFKSKIILRSSAIDEDSPYQSQAGKYLSLKDINPKNKKRLIISINKIFEKYKNKSPLNEVLVQPILKNVSASGVLFTYDNEHGSPYYCIEYDDLTGQTDTVTAGKNDKSRTLYILRDKVDSLRSNRFKKLISAVKEIEYITSFSKLDIEFGINKSNKIFIFQVRPLVIKNAIDRKTSNIIYDRINKLEKNYISINKNKKYGNSNLFGVMPDWNPAEIIGILPKPLSKTFYREIITNKIWAISRKNLGYKNLTETNLMEDFASHPYINTNLSFYSFLPNKLSAITSKKIINFWINDLIRNNYKHDKIEFEICDTCFNFSTDKNLKRFKGVLTKAEIQNYRDELLKLTTNILKSNSKLIKNSLNDLDKLEFSRKKFNLKKKKNFDDIYQLINDIKQYGTLNFANLARLAFISESFLRSLVFKKVIKLERLNRFKNSINTVLTNFVNDTNKLLQKKSSWRKFSEIYGHLRSGTYDIESNRYDKSNYFDTTRLQAHNKTKNIKNFNFEKRELEGIKVNLKKLKLDFSSIEFMNLIKKNITLREYCKFVFTKSVSDILEVIAIKAKNYQISRKDISFLKLEDLKYLDVKKNKQRIIKIIKKNKNEYNYNKLIKLPYLITDKNDFSIVPLLKGVPNYITSKKITAKCLNVKNKQSMKLDNLKNKIILIESADPGYDWLFLYGIAGLITKYGGSNSHMSIRCTEMNIPAVIGCGEQLFRKLKNSNLIEVDCNLSQIKVIN